MNNIKKLFDTTAVRLSLRYSLLYVVILGMAFLVLYWFVTHFVEDQIAVSLSREASKIRSIYRDEGISGVRMYIVEHERFKGEDHRYYLLVDKHGNFIAGDLRVWPKDVNPGKSVRNVWIAEKNIIGKVPDGDGLWPTIAVKLGNGSKVLIAQGIRGLEDLRETLFAVMAIIFGSVVILTFTIGVFLGKDVLSHVDRIEATCSRIMNGDLSMRIPISPKNDEFDAIGKLVNSMLDELEGFIVRSKDMIDSIAHDLRTPLNRIRNKLEGMLLGSNYSEDIVGSVISDTDRIIKMVNSLLSISQIETGIFRNRRDRVSVSEIVRDVIDFYQPLAEEKGITVEVNVEGDLEVMGNRQLLTQAVANVLDNAVKYTSNRIMVSAKRDYNDVVLSVCDNGIGVSPDAYNRITEKFVRLDSSRNSEGNGLGLSLVKAVAELHGAKLEFVSNNPGLCVVLRIPSSG